MDGSIVDLSGVVSMAHSEKLEKNYKFEKFAFVSCKNCPNVATHCFRFTKLRRAGINDKFCVIEIIKRFIHCYTYWIDLTVSTLHILF